ncbi:MAG: hypothetical protein IJW40_03890 [Clostridia bacterium]|nr:hypothetical protein [Clostridia bacterium]
MGKDKKSVRTIIIVIAFLLACALSVGWSAIACEYLFGGVEYFVLSQDVGQIEEIRVRYWDGMSDESLDLGVIDPARYEEFSNGIARMPMSYFTPPAHTVMGVIFEVNYKNGEYDLISACGIYVSEGDYLIDNYSFSYEEYAAFLETYGFEYTY